MATRRSSRPQRKRRSSSSFSNQAGASEHDLSSKRRNISTASVQDPSREKSINAGTLTSVPPPARQQRSISPLAQSKSARGDPTQGQEVIDTGRRAPPPVTVRLPIANLDGAFQSSEATILSSYSDADPEVVNLISPDISPAQSDPQQRQSIQPQQAPPKPRVPHLEASPYFQTQNLQPDSNVTQGLPPPNTPYAPTARDADGAFYPSPYCTVDPQHSILQYDAAMAKKGTSLQPTREPGKQDRYTSVLEHDLAIVKTRLARANQKLEMVEADNDMLRESLEYWRDKSRNLQSRAMNNEDMVVDDGQEVDDRSNDQDDASIETEARGQVTTRDAVAGPGLPPLTGSFSPLREVGRSRVSNESSGNERVILNGLREAGDGNSHAAQQDSASEGDTIVVVT